MVPQDQLIHEDGKAWYLPHHGVRHPKKRKLRVVFDCSAQFQGTSLNEELIQGPNLTNTLLEVAHSLDTDSCINALRRFICRRGQVNESDIGTNFISAEKKKEALDAWNQDKINQAMLQNYKASHFFFKMTQSQCICIM